MLIRDGELVFTQKEEPLLGTLIRDGELVFSQKTKAPARNADPRRTTFSGCVFLRKQELLLGTLIRDEELSFMCTSEIIQNASMLISDHQ